MKDSTTYSVQASGEILEGFDLSQVQEGFAALFKLPPETPAALIKKKFAKVADIPDNFLDVYQY